MLYFFSHFKIKSFLRNIEKVVSKSSKLLILLHLYLTPLFKKMVSRNKECAKNVDLKAFSLTPFLTLFFRKWCQKT